MAVLALTDAFISINSNTLSTSGNHLEVNATIADLDSTTFGSTWKTVIGGLLEGSGSITFLENFTAAALDSIMWPLFIAGVVVPFEFRPTSPARSTSNPGYTGNLLIKDWNPIGNSVGDLAIVKMDFKVSGAIARQTA